LTAPVVPGIAIARLCRSALRSTVDQIGGAIIDDPQLGAVHFGELAYLIEHELPRPFAGIGAGSC
jgi:hypothetical protein